MIRQPIIFPEFERVKRKPFQPLFPPLDTKNSSQQNGVDDRSTCAQCNRLFVSAGTFMCAECLTKTAKTIQPVAIVWTQRVCATEREVIEAGDLVECCYHAIPQPMSKSLSCRDGLYIQSLDTFKAQVGKQFVVSTVAPAGHMQNGWPFMGTIALFGNNTHVWPVSALKLIKKRQEMVEEMLS